MQDVAVPVTAKVEVSRNSVNLKITLHSTAFLLLNICHDPVHLLVVVHIPVTVQIALRKSYLLKICLYINQVHLQDVLYVQRKERAGVARKLYIYVDF